MKRLIALSLALLSLTAHAQKINIGAGFTGSKAFTSYQNGFTPLAGSFIDMLGASVRTDISYNRWQAGVMVDVVGYLTEGKITGEERIAVGPDKSIFTGTKTTEYGRVLLAGVYGNGRQRFMAGKMNVYAGINVAMAQHVQNSPHSYMRYELVNNPEYGPIKMDLLTYKAGLALGAQAGFGYNISKHLALTMELATRRIGYTSRVADWKYVTMTNGTGYASTPYQYDIVVQHRFWVHNVLLGMRYTL